MDLNAILESPFVLIGGAVLVIAVAIFIFMSGRTKSNHETGAIVEPSKTEPNTSPNNQEIDAPAVEKDSSFWRLKRSILGKIRSSKKPDMMDSIDTDVMAVATVLDEKPVVVQSEPVTMVEEVIDEEMSMDSHGETVDETEPEIEDIISESEEEVEAMVDESTDSVLDDYQEDEVEPLETEDLQVEEPQEVEELAETPVPEPEKSSSSSGDDIFAMFMDEEGEENDVSKFAKNLDPVDINDLIEKVEYIKRCIRK